VLLVCCELFCIVDHSFSVLLKIDKKKKEKKEK
jgi:hypothetical protein